jgi:hypothetical protein
MLELGHEDGRVPETPAVDEHDGWLTRAGVVVGQMCLRLLRKQGLPPSSICILRPSSVSRRSVTLHGATSSINAHCFFISL